MTLEFDNTLYPGIRLQKRKMRTDLMYAIETTSNLEAWTPLDIEADQVGLSTSISRSVEEPTVRGDKPVDSSLERLFRVRVTDFSDLFSVLVVYDLFEAEIVAFDTPNYRGSANISFLAVNGQMYAFGVLGFEEDEGKNFIFETE